MHRRFRFHLTVFLLLGFALGLGGCGSSSDEKSPAATTPTPSAAQTGDTSLFPNAQLLASARDLLDRSAGRAVSAAATDPIIIDTRSADAYSAGHIPGAINAEWGAFVQAGAVLKPVADLETQLGALGITRDAQIVTYDDTVTSWGSAGRLFWMFEYLGCTNVKLLNGGWDKWAADGLPIETTANTLPQATFTALVKPAFSSDKDRIAGRLGAADFVTVDTRTDEEFIGWTLYGEARGGHIPDAVQLPYAAYYNDDKSILGYVALQELLDSHGVTADKEIVAYCTAGIRSGFFYFLGRLMGYGNIANYDGSMFDWAAADPATYPMEAAPNFATSVYPAWVKALIEYHAPGSASAAPPEYAYDRDHKYLIFETQWGSFDDMAQGWADNGYLRGHIPGAIHSNSDTYENGFPRWFVLPDEELKAAVGSMGITPDTTVVVYSNSNIFAARLWWILRYAGVADVRILNGGFDAWKTSGYAVETAINEPVATTYDGSIDASLLATTDQVEALYNTASTQVVDVRSQSEYAGLVSGYSYVVNKGRIPGAIWAYDGDDASPAYADPDGTLRSYTEVRELWDDLGIRSTIAPDQFDKDVIFYCGSGYRSSVAFLYAHLLGYTSVRNYSDGWEGWSTTYVEDAQYVSDPDLPGSTDGWRQEPSGRPYETGDPL